MIQAKSRDKFGDLECNLLSKCFVHPPPPLVARDKMKVHYISVDTIFNLLLVYMDMFIGAAFDRGSRLHFEFEIFLTNLLLWIIPQSRILLFSLERVSSEKKRLFSSINIPSVILQKKLPYVYLFTYV